MIIFRWTAKIFYFSISELKEDANGKVLVSGWTKGPPRHSETGWWNEEVAKAIEEKRRT